MVMAIFILKTHDMHFQEKKVIICKHDGSQHFLPLMFWRTFLNVFFCILCCEVLDTNSAYKKKGTYGAASPCHRKEQAQNPWTLFVTRARI